MNPSANTCRATAQCPALQPWAECLHTPNSYVEIPIPHVIVVGDRGVFGRGLGHEVGVLTSGIVLL